MSNLNSEAVPASVLQRQARTEPLCDRSRARGRLPLASLAFMAAVVCTLALATAASAGPFGRSCGKFKATIGDSRVTFGYSAKRVNCRRAGKVVKSFVRHGARWTHHPRSGGDEYWTKASFPGWRCTFGTGGGSCTKKQKQAFYGTNE